MLCGPSGCGKTTLLTNLKKELMPAGRRTGEIKFNGVRIQDLDGISSACDIGYLFQNPDSQIVTDTVIQEIAFPLENIGLPTEEIRNRISEIVAFFGINDILHKNVNELSGGQKQLVNLCSLLVLRPEVLLLDEPMSQLDPIASYEFLSIVRRLNEEFSITVIMSEHKADSIFPFIDKAVFLKDGKIEFVDNAHNICKEVIDDEIVLDDPREKMEIVIEQVEDDENVYTVKQVLLPLFGEALYRTKTAYDPEMPGRELTGVPVIAFHSYKGGVGRTLSLLAFAKAWTEYAGRDRSLLIIDGDIQALGLTWLYKDHQQDEIFSYLDLLVLAQQSRDAGDLAKTVKDHFQLGLLSYENKQRRFVQYFLPTYRYEQQLLDIYASPQTIVQGYKKSFFLSDLFSELGRQLGVDAVLLDLPAGISDDAAPFLFDLRIKKYMVSSTSYPSRAGTVLLLQQMLKGIQITEDTRIPEIFLTKVRKGEAVEEIHRQLRAPFEEHTEEDKSELLDHVIHDLSYVEDLVRLETLQDIMTTFDSTGRNFHDPVGMIARKYMKEEKRTEGEKEGEGH